MIEIEDMNPIDDAMSKIESDAIRQNSSFWITKTGCVEKIRDLETPHLNNINRMFGIMFKRLLRVKLELFMRRIHLH